MQPEAILETCLYADDLAAAESFYREVFGLERVTRSEGRHVFFRCGSGMLLIFNPAASRIPSGGDRTASRAAVIPVCTAIASALPAILKRNDAMRSPNCAKPSRKKPTNIARHCARSARSAIRRSTSPSS